jgi:hypothetical protein
MGAGTVPVLFVPIGRSKVRLPDFCVALVSTLLMSHLLALRCKLSLINFDVAPITACLQRQIPDNECASDRLIKAISKARLVCAGK